MDENSFASKLIKAQQLEDQSHDLQLERERAKLEAAKLAAEHKRSQNELLKKKIEKEDKNIQLLDDKLELSREELKNRSNEYKTRLEISKTQIKADADALEKKLNSKELTSMAKDYARIEAAKIKAQETSDIISSRHNAIVYRGQLLNDQMENRLALANTKFERDKEKNKLQSEWLEFRREQFEYKKKLNEEKAAKEKAERAIEASRPVIDWLVDDLGVPLQASDIKPTNLRRCAEYMAFRILYIHLPKGDMYRIGNHGELYWRQEDGNTIDISYDATWLERAAQTVMSITRAQASEITRIVLIYIQRLDEDAIRISGGRVWRYSTQQIEPISEPEEFDIFSKFPWVAENIEKYLGSE